ncbi:hypothetical protein H8356DRAFT_1644171 [Neocallimastix lanati (nom. inval.)]|nr:hypothetical protein H8356DRAFT_1644171 [Neocallimastix sp. JGI-2020a]
MIYMIFRYISMDFPLHFFFLGLWSLLFFIINFVSCFLSLLFFVVLLKYYALLWLRMILKCVLRIMRYIIKIFTNADDV